MKIYLVESERLLECGDSITERHHVTANLISQVWAQFSRLEDDKSQEITAIIKIADISMQL